MINEINPKGGETQKSDKYGFEALNIFTKSALYFLNYMMAFCLTNFKLLPFKILISKSNILLEKNLPLKGLTLCWNFALPKDMQKHGGQLPAVR